MKALRWLSLLLVVGVAEAAPVYRPRVLRQAVATRGNGPLIPTPATAVSHVYMVGGQLVDAKGLAWTQNGTPKSGFAPLYPAQRAAGPLTDAAYWGPIGGATSDGLDSTGDRWGCLIFVPAPAGGQDSYFSNGSNAVSGYLVETTVANVIRFVSRNPTNVIATCANAVVYGSLNVACWWRTGTNIYAKTNLGTTATAAAGTEVSGTAYGAKIGRHESAGTPVTGGVVEIVQGLGACPGASCEAFAVQVQSAVLARRTK